MKDNFTITEVAAPPKPQNPKHDWTTIANAAREKDGKWLRVVIEGGFTTATVGSIQDGRNNYIDPDEFEVRSGDTYTNEEGNRRCNMYIRLRTPEEIAQRKKETK